MIERIASPLTLVAEHINEGADLNRILFLTYTFDVNYFERVALSLLQGTRAAICVVADAQQVEFDIFGPGMAGRRYGVGRVHHNNAFHPKLVVLQGSTSTTVAVGSANVTMAGWHASEELWTVFRSGSTETDRVLAETGDWLVHLARDVVLGKRVRDFVAETGRRLQDEVVGSVGAQLIGNLDASILEQLPAGPVDELNLYAPFHDRGATAVKRLIQRLRPSRVRLGYQRGRTIVNGPQLESVLRESGVKFELLEVEATRYRHGKLIEWCVGDQWTALTGSANLSNPALCQTADVGNFELGVIQEIAEPLFPTGSVVAGVESIQDCESPSVPAMPAESLPEILEAVADGELLIVSLTKPLSVGAVLESVPRGESPDSWQRWATLPLGLSTIEVDLLAGGSWLRLDFGDNRYSRPIPVLAPASLLARTSSRGGARHVPDMEDIFDDPKAADRFFQQLISLKDELGLQTGASTAAKNAGQVNAGAATMFLGWEEYLERFGRTMGDGFTLFALGMPRAGPAAGTTAVSDWDDEGVADDEAGLDGDDAETLETTAVAVTGQPRSYGQAERKRIAKWLDRLSRMKLHDPTIQLGALRVTLTYVVGGAWPDHDRGWVKVILRHVNSIRSAAVDSPELRSRQAALVTAALTWARSEVPLVPSSPESSEIRRAADKCHDLFADLDGPALREYCTELSGHADSSVWEDRAIDYALRAGAGDQFDRAIEGLSNAFGGIVAERRGNVLLLPKSVDDPIPVFLTVFAVLDDEQPYVVQVGLDESAAVLVWSRPSLVYLRLMKTGAWRANVYRVPNGFGPSSYANRDDLPKSSLAMPGTTQWGEVAAVLSECGLDPTQLPPC